MYNYNELNAVELSPTKKDYYQVWNELIDVAGKLSERWNPSATNESDPGIVLLKVLTAITDKLNYNIDANTLEAFMPSAAQEGSMRKLCEMLGYEMRYFQSAATTVRITYRGDNFPAKAPYVINIDRFTNIKDLDSTVNYITLEPVQLSPTSRSATVECLEGELVPVQTDLGNVITLIHLDDNNRFYFPEKQIASNGLFINSLGSAAFWQQTDNLNTCLLGSTVYKFGFDSSVGLPYIQFPDDIGSLIGTGLEIKFVRTRGVSGNISLNTLRVMEAPSSWTISTEQETDEVSATQIVEGQVEVSKDWLDLENYSITNLSPARNGKNPETIDEAYWNYQKSIGILDTLVTCRDYMNKIYQMTVSEADTTPLVSNILVSDIRDDINRAYTLTTMSEHGLEYKRYAKKDEQGKDRINYFDLVLYPFQATFGLNTPAEFESSFRYTSDNNYKILPRLEENKTIAHNMISPTLEDISCLKVYFQLSARLTTTSKISVLEAVEVELAAHRALFKNFNMRHLNFGDEIPFESILKVLTLADPRIKNVTLDDPKMTVVVCQANGREIPIISNTAFSTQQQAQEALNYYKQLVLENVLAGKVALFNYDQTFATSFTDKLYPAGNTLISATASKLLPNIETLVEFTDGPCGKQCSKSLANLTSSTTNTIAAYMTTKPGSLALGLSYKDGNVKLSQALAAVVNLKFKLYSPGASKASYIINCRPRLINEESTELALYISYPSESGTWKDDNDTEILKVNSFTLRPSILNIQNIASDQESYHFLGIIPFNNLNTDTIFDKITLELDTKADASQEDLKLLENIDIQLDWSDPCTKDYYNLEEHHYDITSEENLNASANYIYCVTPTNLNGAQVLGRPINLELANVNTKAVFDLKVFWPGARRLSDTLLDEEFKKFNGIYHISYDESKEQWRYQYCPANKYLKNSSNPSENFKECSSIYLSEQKLKLSVAINSVQDFEIFVNNQAYMPQLSLTLDDLIKTTPIKLPTLVEPSKSEVSFTTLKDSKLEEVTGKITSFSKLEAEVQIDTQYITDIEPLTLSTGEVVQFRAPNFKTKATYPAYVNYFVKLNPSLTTRSRANSFKKSSPAIPATMMTLLEFFEGGSEGYTGCNNYKSYPQNKEDKTYLNSWNRRHSWEEKINTMPSELISKVFTIKDGAEILEGTETEAEANNAYNSCLALYKALFIKDANDKYVLYEKVKDKDLEEGLAFYAVKLTDSNFEIFLRWLKGAAASSNGPIIYREDESSIPGTQTPSRLDKEQLIKAAYTRILSNLSRPIGLLVDSNRFKYSEASSLGIKPLENLFIPKLWSVSNDLHTMDGLGTDAHCSGIKANTEYQLRAGEYILINYSTSEGREDGTTVSKNLVIPAGTVVKANFELVDSAEKANTAKYPKTSNFGPWVFPDRSILAPTAIEGMFTLGATEQIEVREPIVVQLDGDISNLYWELRDPIKAGDYESIPFNKNNKYILQPGEYLFYTDASKESMAYYGAGTELQRSANTPELKRKVSTATISLEDIEALGVVAAIPWTPFSLSGDNAALKISEYQIINLAAGDSLGQVVFPEGVEDSKLTSEYKPVHTANYTIGGQEGSLPELAIEDYFWEARSKLEISLGPSYPQTLTVHTNSAGQEVARDLLKLYTSDMELTQVYTPIPSVSGDDSTGSETGYTVEDLAIYASAPLIGADGTYKFKVTSEDDDKAKKQEDQTTSFKACAREVLKFPNNLPCSLVFNNDGLANIAFIDQDRKETQSLVKLNALLVDKDTQYGLLTIYYKPMHDNNFAAIRLTSMQNGTKVEPQIFNYSKEASIDSISPETWTWWADSLVNKSSTTLATNYYYYLREGLNTIVLRESCFIELFTSVAETNKVSNILRIGQLRIIPKTNMLNYQLAFASRNQKKGTVLDTSLKFYYKAETTNNPEADSDDNILSLKVSDEEALAYIRQLDPNNEFYYTYEPPESSGLDLNALDPTDTLALPKAWFDSQNIANKFIINSLDSDYLQQYIIVSKFSKELKLS